jgi:hypothetical protein
VTLIAEDLLLLLLDDRSGKPQTAHLEIALGGAVLVDLALEGLVEVASHGSLLGSAKPRSSGCCWPCTVCTGRSRIPTRVPAP